MHNDVKSVRMNERAKGEGSREAGIRWTKRKPRRGFFLWDTGSDFSCQILDNLDWLGGSDPLAFFDCLVDWECARVRFLSSFVSGERQDIGCNE